MLVGNKEYNDNSKGLETSIGTWHTDYAFKIIQTALQFLNVKKVLQVAHTQAIYILEIFMTV